MKNHLSLIVTLALLAVLPARGEGIDSLKFCQQKGDSLMQQYNTFEALKHYQRAYDLAKKRSQQQAVEHLDLPLDPALDAEALRLVNAMPKWTPGKQDGVPMRVKYTIPITFTLGDGPASHALKEQAANQRPEVIAIGYDDRTARNGLQEEQPLIIVDDKEVPFEQLGKIDPKTIDHIDVLKNKESIEKYGAKGKNSVVLITTKKGK